MIKGCKFASLLVVLAIVLSLVVFVFPVSADDPVSNAAPPEFTTGPTPESVSTVQNGGNAVGLLIQDDNPWGFNSPNQAAMDQLGVRYDVINSANIGGYNLSGYCFIMFASDQKNAYYHNIVANMATIEAYVRNGGLLLAHSCDYGWNGGSWAGFSILPGGITHETEYFQNINIVDLSHQVVTGYGAFVLTDAYLSNWYYSTHGYFTKLVAGTYVIMQVAGENCVQRPTYIDYNVGSGKVLASMHPMEWGYAHHYYSHPEFLLNEFRYAKWWCSKPKQTAQMWRPPVIEDWAAPQGPEE